MLFDNDDALKHNAFFFCIIILFLLFLVKGANMKKSRITLDDRINIQAGLEKHLNMNELSKLIKKNPSSIYRELHLNSIFKESNRKGCFYCSKIEECRKNGVFLETMSKYKCKDYEPIKCSSLNKYPYVCNGCPFIEHCYKNKKYYNCTKAETISRYNRITTRKKKRTKAEDINYINEVVTPLVKKGQSLHHIYESNQKLRKICSERTIRRLIYDGYLDVSASCLPRYVRFKHTARDYSLRKNKMANIERMLERTFTDYKKYLKRHPDVSAVQYDSVIGKKTDKKAILTITFPKERFQFGRLIQKGDPMSVIGVMNYLFNLVGYEKAKEIFAVNLADNGFEFSNFHLLEIRDVKVYFTNPYRSTDKAQCERNHEFIRYIIPKKRSMDNLTQDKLNLMFSHINSYIRKSNQNKTPFDLIKERFGSEFLSLIGINKIAPQDVLLKPDLLK